MAQLNSEAGLYALVIAFLIGLSGSLHCVGMCGPLVSVTSKTKWQTVLYQVGRLLGYLLVGLTIGLLGKAILFKISRPLNIVFSILIAAFFIYLGVRLYINKPLSMKMPSIIQKIWNSLNLKKQGNTHSFLVGLFSIFLPCGFLYAVLFATMSLQNLAVGLGTIVAFWMGTLPAMVSAPVLLNKVLQPFMKRRPQLTGLFLVSLGILTLFIRFQNSQSHCLFCH